MKTINIEKNGWRAEIAPELGGNVVCLQHNGTDVYVPLTNMAQREENPYLQGSPILLPANRTKDGKFTFGGQEYILPVNEPYTGAHLHGLVHLQPFTPVVQTKDAVTLRFENAGEVYPFPFELQVCYKVAGNAFEQHYMLKNIGTVSMPLTFALHTTFVEPERFSVPLESCQQKNEFHIPTGRYVALNSREQSYVIGSPSKGQVISGYYKAAGQQAKVGDFLYTVSDVFDHWVLFNGRGESGLLCVEPQCGAVNGLNMPESRRVLQAGEKLVLWTKLEKAE